MLGDRREAAPMGRAGAEQAQRRQVRRRAVALVLREAMTASRAVLARIDAAEIAGSLSSPPMSSSIAQSSRGARLPSIRARSTRSARPVTARSIASRVARRMFSWSISATEALAIDQPAARSRISSASVSRRAADSFFESRRPSIGRSTSRTTAAAYTGPASGPRPASSTPQMIMDALT